MNDISCFLETAKEAAYKAGSFIKSNYAKIDANDVLTKNRADYVTFVDKEAEKLIIDIVKDKFPKHSVLAEESSETKGEENAYRWIIDPLDGTTNFIHGFPMFCVSIALEYNDDIIIGVVYEPMRDELFYASKDNGAFLNGSKIYVRDNFETSTALVATGFPFRFVEHIDNYMKLFKLVFENVSGIRRAGSAALDLAYTACGRCDGFFEMCLKPWDIAAGSLLIKEAGGHISGFAGNSNYLFKGNIVAGEKKVYDILLRQVRDVFPGWE